MLLRKHTLFALVISALACSTTTPVSHQALAGVSLTLDHFGVTVNPLDQRFAEAGSMPQAHNSGKDPWLRLTNNSGHVIAFRTYSTYIKPPLRWFDLPNGTKVIALEEGMEIALPFRVESRRGSEVDFASGGDMFWESFLPTGRSVLFSVPAAALKRERKVFVEYQKAVEPHGTNYRIYFQSKEE
jgi:hypothetical protein